MRNYLYHIIDRGTHTIALPGKFTLCFSLLKCLCGLSGLSGRVRGRIAYGFRGAWTPGDFHDCRDVGIEPVERVELKEEEEVGHYIEQPMHYRLAKQLAMREGERVTHGNKG